MCVYSCGWSRARLGAILVHTRELFVWVVTRRRHSTGPNCHVFVCVSFCFRNPNKQHLCTCHLFRPVVKVCTASSVTLMSHQSTHGYGTNHVGVVNLNRTA